MDTFRPQAAVFDMDGVLVDTSTSYQQGIADSVSLYLQAVLGMESPGDGVPMSAVEGLKGCGGFNNEWDSTRALLHRLLSRIEPLQRVEPGPRPWTEWASYLAEEVDLPSIQEAIACADFPSFIADLDAKGGGVDAAHSICGADGWAWMKGTGSLLEENLVDRIFQEHYLGPDFFSEIYGEPVQFDLGPGLIHSETPLLDREALTELSRRIPLAIATGRPAAEAELALRVFGLKDVFSTVVSLDDAQEEQARSADGLPREKPHPFPVLEALRRLGVEGSFVFVGDLPDDMIAARAAAVERGVEAFAIGLAGPDPGRPAALKRFGADDVFTDATSVMARIFALLDHS
ncbi:MAG: hypothetical protein CMH54_03810 [Myxococcales bacterium]|nr:hypothetical protein [Myxococcales bacterium]